MVGSQKEVGEALVVVGCHRLVHPVQQVVRLEVDARRGMQVVCVLV